MAPKKSAWRKPATMQQPLRLNLRILDHEPAAAVGSQLWKGGPTDLSTRTVIADPPRWLTVSDHAADQAPPQIERTPLREWALEQINPGSLASPQTAGGVILVSMNVDPAREDEFNDWYNTEHIPHFNRLAGVIAARRFRAIEGDPRYVALYHVENTGIYATPGWMAANQTPWILRMRRFQRDRIYFMFGERNI
jgi:hypothetical protein